MSARNANKAEARAKHRARVQEKRMYRWELRELRLSWWSQLRGYFRGSYGKPLPFQQFKAVQKAVEARR